MLPAVHVTYRDGKALKAWLATGAGHTGRITGTRFDTAPANEDIVDAMSARGPTTWGACCLRPVDGFYARRRLDILKPDVTAPGVGIWAADRTEPNEAVRKTEFAFRSGTSMSSAHVAGAMALLRAVHADWTPAEMLSALMTAATTDGVRKEDRATPADWFDTGAGRIDVGRAAAAGFVLDTTAAEFLAANPEDGGDPATLNLASMADFSCLAECRWSRTIRSALDRPVRWTAEASATSGGILTVTPETFVLPPGGAQTLTVSADVSRVEPGTYVFGRVDLEPEPTDGVRDGNGRVPAAHLPVAIRAAAAALPSSVIGALPPIVVATTTEAQGRWTVAGLRTLEAPRLHVRVAGLAPATVRQASLGQDPTPHDPYDGGEGMITATLEVLPGARRLVAEVDASSAYDIDLVVGRDDNRDGRPHEEEVRCLGSTASWQELCDIRDPQVGPWWVLVQNWTGSSEAPDDVTFRYGVVGGGDSGNLRAAAPPVAELGVPNDVTLDWYLETKVEPWDIWYGVVDVSSGRGGLGDLVSFGLDVLGREPMRIFLPATRSAGPATGRASG